MSAEFEEIFDTYDQCRDFDVALANGVLTVDMADLGTYVINKQTPNQEIWFSSPLSVLTSAHDNEYLTRTRSASRSGPKRFKYDEDLHEWRSPTETYPLHELLRREISELLQTPVDFIKPSPEWY
ncbi:uncharacterized protein MONBRDRAFT_28012 [Monosiga brevicollis MX1]|uniref:Frataxin n=1 Tax=Monosiga brevicollis TaxID=81824 RepID=A9V6Y3_MONBE|nr:uncharacterized protein MONBRDRAFT_28012 [Monosiga brevicollis MX1]EDQ86624.1 predicted protein [Monosiga brevicollis MX1]|eukprot:XP_001748460.1 hypothetical protein [Monosiga brevicollis MX1]